MGKWTEYARVVYDIVSKDLLTEGTGDIYTAHCIGC